MSEGIIYLGLFLTEESQMKLRKEVKVYHQDAHIDHVTLVFKPSSEHIALLKPIAERIVPFSATSMYFDSKGQAVRVSLPDFGLGSDHPMLAHVTISCAAGVPPKYSQELIAKGFNIPLIPILLQGLVDSFPRGLLRK